MRKPLGQLRSLDIGALASALCELTPLLVFYHTLGYALSMVCLKNCGTISSDLAVALAARGFDVRIVSLPGHFVCGVNVGGVGVEVDLSHLQFATEVQRVHADYTIENPELEIHTRFRPRLWANPYIAGRVRIQAPYRSAPIALHPDADAEMAKRLRNAARTLAREHPDYAHSADASTMLAPLCALL